MATKITYTFPASAPAPFTGKTFTGGVPEPLVVKNKVITVVRFKEIIQGKGVVARIDDKPELALEVARYNAELEAEKNQAKEALENAVPGLSILREAKQKAANEHHRASSAFNRMMETGSSILPKAEDMTFAETAKALAAQYPRAALYLCAEAQAENTSWADNTGKGAAAKEAMAILKNGGTIEDAQKAMEYRRELID